MERQQLKEILQSNKPLELKALFSFDKNNSDEQVLFKFNLFGRKLFPHYFKSQDAPFHAIINQYNLKVYRGTITQFVNIAFRGAAKDVKTKLFIAFAILNDMDHFRKYYKCLSQDGTNSTQSVTDIYNILVDPSVTAIYPEVFEKTAFKRQETMSAFTTATGVKVLADTINVDQRGALQEEARPDFIWFNDFETRKTLRSAVTSRAIWDNMEEARTGLEKGGGCVYTCNYISELGNVHKLVTEKLSDRKYVLIMPILDSLGEPTWNRYTKEDIEQMKVDDDDFEGERMCKPSASKDIMFDRAVLDSTPVGTPIRVSAEFKMYAKYDPAHRYGSGHDVAGGVGLDSSTSVFIDFSSIPARVVATFHSNTTAPEAFGAEIFRETDFYGGNIAGIENNKFDQAVLKARQLGARVWGRNRTKDVKLENTGIKEYGWNTNSLTKPSMFLALRKAVDDGHLLLVDEDLIKEAKAYSRNDLMDREVDARLVNTATRHFDLLTAAAIAFQMKDYAEVNEKEPININDTFKDEEIYNDIFGIPQ